MNRLELKESELEYITGGDAVDDCMMECLRWAEEKQVSYKDFLIELQFRIMDNIVFERFNSEEMIHAHYELQKINDILKDL